MNRVEGIVLKLIPGLLSAPLINDMSAVIRCRCLVFELKDLLTDLERFLTFSGMVTEERVIERLEQIKKVIQQLTVDHSVMLFRNPLLAEKLQDTLPLFSEYRLLDHDAARTPHAIAVRINACVWGIDSSPPYESTIISQIQKFLNLSQPRRFLVWARAKVSRKASTP